MTENDVKVLLKSMKKLKAKREVLKCLRTADDEYQNICVLIAVIESIMDMLNDSEKEIIQMHLVEGRTWEQLMTKYEELHGKQNGYSRRTYERMQQKAIKQILEVVNGNEIEGMMALVSVTC